MTSTTPRWLRRNRNPEVRTPPGATRTAAPPARRLPRARLADLRLWLGVTLVVASTAAGAMVLQSAGDSVTVWQATRDLSVGSSPTGLVPVAVTRTVGESAYAAPGDDLDAVLLRPVAAGELLPRSAMAPAPAMPRRRVTVPVDPMHAPVDLQPGDVVDVWSTPRDPSGADPGQDLSPRLVLAAVTIAAAGGDALGIGGELGVVLDVPQERVPDLVTAVRAGATDLVAVPITSQRMVR